MACRAGRGLIWKRFRQHSVAVAERITEPVADQVATGTLCVQSDHETPDAAVFRI
jgi:hypothetical protein